MALRSTNIDEMYETLKTWIAGISGRECFIENDTGPPGDTPYCTVFISDVMPFGHDTSTYSEDRAIETLRGLCHPTVKIAAWGGDSLRVVNRIRNAIYADMRTYDLWAIMGKGLVSPITDLSNAAFSGIEKRTEFKMQVYASLSSEFTSAGSFDHSDPIPINRL